ncbi:uncharacterized protein K02A2.6-like [Mizuhopecten yessoensis]|uniref:uncharacterized protein K02A2.6-like n=1 Tax=Mizuhopecten yessoensis TaxID=6573 RepID=UPI000B4575E2|nr:uncharacterized protein K02A2.6-like [Mizuhopecten yessoensis]
MLKLHHKGQTTPVHFVVAEKAATAILGVKACDKLNLVKRVFNIDKSTQSASTESIVQDFSDVFEGLGCLPGYHSIQVDSSVKPVVHPCRKVPFAIQDRLKDEIDRMEKLEVICKEDNPTQWVSSMVVVEKKNGQLRVCLDPRDLNRAIQREHYKLPTREEIMSKFKDTKYFSKLDASSGFWQMRLDSDSSKLTCFNTPFGRYRFLRLPFGISSAPEVYHKAIHMLFEHVEGASSIMDDIIVWGSTLEEHNQRLRKVLEATRAANLKLNKDKCVCGVQSLTFIGDVVSAEGMKPDPLKVRAIQTSESKKDVQRFFTGEAVLK